jgi:hypothetical protein
MSPYWTTTEELAKRFAHNEARRIIFQGLLNYRRALVGVGVVNGFQWLDGSFMEDIERLENRNPGDVDVVTFGALPSVPHPQKSKFFQDHEDLFLPQKTKAQFSCDAYFVDLELKPRLIVDKTKYWFGVFSHKKVSHLWKGMIAIPLDSNDSAAWALIT